MTANAHLKYGLVLSGGGIRIASHAGVLAEMEHWSSEGRPWLDRFDVLVGTSAGAIYAAFLAAGYTPELFAYLASLFGRPELKSALFDLNVDKVAAAFLRHDFSYVRGVSSAGGILSLFETVLSHPVRDELLRLNPADTSDAAKQQAAARIRDLWHERRARPRDRAYYADLITFADVRRQLYLVGTNAYTGQKTVFCKLSDPALWKAEDDALSRDFDMEYINPPTREKVARKSQQLATELDFRRFENRVYRQFDQSLYGPQLPLALGVRASLSVPGIFEPAKIQRRADSNRARVGAGDGESPARRRPDPANANPKPESDFFLDGAVDDNFSLSVAAQSQLGDCTHMLGIFLGNLGYRVPDPESIRNIARIVMRTTDYLGDATVDAQRFSQRLTDRHITIINALTAKDASLQDTEQVAAMIDEGRGMARSFWQTMHSEPEYPQPVTVDPAKIFPDNSQQRIFLSEAAQIGPDSFARFKAGVSELPDPTPDDVLAQVPALFTQGSPDGFAGAWRWVYVVLFFISFGLVSLLIDLISGHERRRSIPLRGILSAGLIVALRAGLYKFWQQNQTKG